MERRISKSKYLAGLQCRKYLWHLYNDPDKIPPYDEAALFRFQQGHEVGNLAKSLYPDGMEVEHGVDIEAELAMARKLTGLDGDGPAGNYGTITGTYPNGDMTSSAGAAVPIVASAAKAVTQGTTTGKFRRRPLFEPAFAYKNSFARADILEPADSGKWNIIEVKSSSSVKDINKHDISFQKYCYEGAGLKINKCHIMYLDKNFMKEGPIDPGKFFAVQDVTAEAEMLRENVEQNIALMLDTINSKTCPDVSIGKDCYSPYECPLRPICWSNLPENNVFELYKGKELACYFYRDGITEISQIKKTAMLNPVQLMQYSSVVHGRPYIDRESIGRFLEQLKYPLYFLDFETFATAIPLFDGLRPYQNIPFQYSCHILKSPEGTPQSLYFLAGNDMTDPRQGFLESLKRALGYESQPGPSGSILVYFKSFEKKILEELAERFPEHARWIEDATGRIIDLYEPFGKFYYYSHRQKGSASLKNVLPALTGISYDDMQIKNGQEASIKYLNIIFLKGEEKPDMAQVEKIRKDLLDYCGLDTEGMIYILRELYRIAGFK